MLVWLAEHLIKYYSGFNVFSYLTFSRHRQLADRAVHSSIVDGPAYDCSFKTFLWSGGA